MRFFSKFFRLFRRTKIDQVETFMSDLYRDDNDLGYC